MTIRRDPNGQPMTIGFNGSEHFFLYNAQGDVVAIANYSGEIVVEYTYDAWGNPLSCTGSPADTLGKKNPFRYRGYVYDEETGLYYLNSRYYDPRVGRFICSDGSKNKKGDSIYNLTYTWHDIIDPNLKYSTDREKAQIAEMIPFANPMPYELSITWTDVTVIRANPAFLNWDYGWLK